MDWVANFYTKQNEWSGCYLGDVTNMHRQKAALIELFIGPGSKRILELGAGGGQVAAAMADLGHTVVAIEIIPTLIAHAQQLAAQTRPGRLRVVAGDFHTLPLEETFDIVCYWDGFGIGTDADQRQLLHRITGWLVSTGSALIEVFTPWYAASVAGKGWQVGQAERRYEFDAEECRWLDTWWPIGQPSQSVRQSLRCYSPADLRLLIEPTGLWLNRVKPGGTIDWEKQQYVPSAPLAQAISYVAQLCPIP